MICVAAPDRLSYYHAAKVKKEILVKLKIPTTCGN